MAPKRMHFVQIDPMAWRAPPQKSSRSALMVAAATVVLGGVLGAWQLWQAGW